LCGIFTVFTLCGIALGFFQQDGTVCIIAHNGIGTLFGQFFHQFANFCGYGGGANENLRFFALAVQLYLYLHAALFLLSRCCLYHSIFCRTPQAVCDKRWIFAGERR